MPIEPEDPDKTLKENAEARRRLLQVAQSFHDLPEESHASAVCRGLKPAAGTVDEVKARNTAVKQVEGSVFKINTD